MCYDIMDCFSSLEFGAGFVHYYSRAPFKSMFK